MYNRIFQPNEIYLNINFETIKQKLNKRFKNIDDYGSIVLIKNKGYMISINNIGKIEIFSYNYLCFNNEISFIESLFKEQISSFSIVH